MNKNDIDVQNESIDTPGVKARYGIALLKLLGFFALIMLLLFSCQAAFAFDPEVNVSTFNQTPSTTIAFTETVAKYCPSSTGECTDIIQPFVATKDGFLKTVKLDLCRFNGTGSGTYQVLIWSSSGGNPGTQLVASAQYNIADLVANTSSGICTSWDTKTFDFESEGVVIGTGSQYFIAVRGIGAEQYTGKKAIQVSAANYDYVGNPHWSDYTLTHFYPSDSSWNTYSVRFEVMTLHQIFPNLPSYVACLPHNYIPPGTGDQGDIQAIFSNTYQWLADTPVIGDALFISCLYFIDFYGHLTDTPVTDLTYHWKAWGRTQDINIPLSTVYTQVQGWTSGIAGYETFKTLLDTVLWTLILAAFFLPLVTGYWKSSEKEQEKEIYRQRDFNDLDI